MGIKTSETSYVTIKAPHRLLGETYEKCVPVGATRVAEVGEVEALVILISGDNAERKIWIRKSHIVC